MTKKALKQEIDNNSILVCITVRGSGSVHRTDDKRRALWDVCGKPLVQWALESILACEYVNKVVVCTEDRQIKDVVEDLGVTVIDRPLYQARDFPRNYSSGIFRRLRARSLTAQAPLVYTETMEYILYWLDEYQKYTPDIFILAHACQPLSKTSTLNKVIEMFFEDDEAAMVRTFYPLSHYVWMDNPVAGRRIPLWDLDPLDRQLYPRLYGIGDYILWGHPVKASSQGRRVAAVDITVEEAIDVHTKEDLYLAECYMKRRLEKKERRSTDEEGSVDCTSANPCDNASGSFGLANLGE